MNRLTSLLPFRTPTPLELAARELEQARRDRLAASASREYYEAMELMLTARIERLVDEIASLSATISDETPTP